MIRTPIAGLRGRRRASTVERASRLLLLSVNLSVMSAARGARRGRGPKL